MFEQWLVSVVMEESEESEEAEEAGLTSLDVFELSLGLVSLLRQSVALWEETPGSTHGITFHNTLNIQVIDTRGVQLHTTHSEGVAHITHITHTSHTSSVQRTKHKEPHLKRHKQNLNE